MPELPEVETIRNNLRLGTAHNPAIIGMIIGGGQLLWGGCLVKPTEEEFLHHLVGQNIQEVGRRGKYLVFSLSREVMLIHLGMSGDLLVEPSFCALAPHYRLVLDFESGQRLAFNDPRKFGRVWLLEDPTEVLDSLGPEPLDLEMNAQILFERLHRHRRQLKPLLMDQGFLAGMGNIYTDEALHLAHLHPLRLSHLLSFQEVERLWESIRQILQEGIKRNGSSIDWVYRGGDFQNYLRVYQRTGKPCPECGAPIKRFMLGQRGTHFCPICQPLKPDHDILNT
jgi:formamidopyrimidine-DNA glycosylase